VNFPDQYLLSLQHQPIVIATQHGKEKVIAPPLASTLRLQPFIPASFDSDAFGTFTGEIPRPGDVPDTLRQKCLAAMSLCDCPLGIASEGSFGPHPSIPFIPADDECLIFIDQRYGYEIIVREVSTHTNFNSQAITSWEELAAFAEWVDFPRHALILRTTQQLRKGIASFDELRDAYKALHGLDELLTAETDMRALYNPKRMDIIEKATHKLLSHIMSLCPDCGAPGFVVRAREPGLPCAQCGIPTPSAIRAIKSCIACDTRLVQDFPDGRTHEDPGKCTWCNP
jgi:hypothetical protein